MTVPDFPPGADDLDVILPRASTRDLLVHLIGRVDMALTQLATKADRHELEAVRDDVRELQETNRTRAAVEAAREKRETSWGRRAGWVAGAVLLVANLVYDVVNVESIAHHHATHTPAHSAPPAVVTHSPLPAAVVTTGRRTTTPTTVRRPTTTTTTRPAPVPAPALPAPVTTTLPIPVPTTTVPPTPSAPSPNVRLP